MDDYNEKNSFSLLEESILLLQNGKATEKKVDIKNRLFKYFN